jgi:hypothetical protein
LIGGWRLEKWKQSPRNIVKPTINIQFVGHVHIDNMYLFVATRNKTNVCMIVFSFYSISRSLREKIQPPLSRPCYFATRALYGMF